MSKTGIVTFLNNESLYIFSIFREPKGRAHLRAVVRKKVEMGLKFLG